MEPKFQTSFIPKAPIVSSKGEIKRPVNFLMLIGLIIFLASIALAATVYGYKTILTQQNTSLKENLAKTKDNFDPDFIREISRLNTRIDKTKSLLKTHLAASTIFDFLGNNTLKSISYTDFSYGYKGTSITLTTKGVASSYESIALQSQVFGQENKYIKNPVFSDLNLDQNGNVTFSLTAILDQSLLDYSKTVDANAVNQMSNEEQAQPVKVQNPAPAVSTTSVKSASTTTTTNSQTQ